MWMLGLYNLYFQIAVNAGNRDAKVDARVDVIWAYREWKACGNVATEVGP